MLIFSNETKQKIKSLLITIYGDDTDSIYEELERKISNFQYTKKSDKRKSEWVTEKDVYLITYADSIIDGEKRPLKVMEQFLNTYLKGVLNTVHFLPFYPWTSDDGFSVVDYREVNKELGSWEDVESIGGNFKLMFDAVFNHISAKSSWFQGYLAGEEKYKDYFIEIDKELWGDNLKKVTRPRVLPLLTDFETSNGTKHIWTTFSEDQIDVNIENKQLFLELCDILLQYVNSGATSIRLDAIGFLYKKLGTSCIHLEETHNILKIWRLILDTVDPSILLISETNVPYKDNITYFGNGFDEMRMVYQFPLSPLIVHTMQSASTVELQNFLKIIKPPTNETTFFNFLSSHDGIGVVPATGLLTTEQIENMIENVKKQGGQLSYKTDVNGNKTCYEMNINYLEALSPTDAPDDTRAKILLAALSILITLQGAPAIYIHTLLGSLNDYKGLKATGRNRSINREKLGYTELKQELANKNSLRHMIFYKIKEYLAIRTAQPAFSPLAAQTILDTPNGLIGIQRQKSNDKISYFVNCSKNDIHIDLDAYNIRSGKSLTTGDDIKNSASITLKPYDFIWIKED